MRLPLLLALLPLLVSASSYAPHPHPHAQPRSAPRPARRGEGGWGPVIQDPGTMTSVIPVREGAASLYAWTREGQDWTRLKRVVFVVHGKGRDPWNYLNHTTIALQDAIAAGLPVSNEEVGIWAPSFWNDQDSGAWPFDNSTQQPTSNLLVWRGNEWQDGRSSLYPPGLNISTFEALDSVVSYFSNRLLFPAVEDIVLASHSMGSQLLQKYAFLGDIPSGVPSLRFALGNLGAYTYFDEQRPANVAGALPLDQCGDYNEYRFGLDGVDDVIEYSSPTPNRELLLERFRSRSFHLLLSQNDDGPGNIQCAAKTQGDSHRSRGAAWYEYMSGPMGGWPGNHTIDWIETCTHDDLCVFRSPPSQRRLFLPASAQEAGYMPHGPVNDLWSAGNVSWSRGGNATLQMPTGTQLRTASLQTYVPPPTSTATAVSTADAGQQQKNAGQPSSAASCFALMGALTTMTAGIAAAAAVLLL